MIITKQGLVIPYTEKGVPPDHISAKNNARYFRRGVKLNDLLTDCWSRNLSDLNTLNICSVNGYSFCVVEQARRNLWKRLDKEWDDYRAQNESTNGWTLLSSQAINDVVSGEESI